MQPAAAETPIAAGVDLVLEDITLAAPATVLAGPAYQVQFRNQGVTDAGDFAVRIVATREGLPMDQAVQAIVVVPGLAAGQSATATLRLPKSAMQMASLGQGGAAGIHQLDREFGR